MDTKKALDAIDEMMLAFWEKMLNMFPKGPGRAGVVAGGEGAPDEDLEELLAARRKDDEAEADAALTEAELEWADTDDDDDDAEEDVWGIVLVMAMTVGLCMVDLAGQFTTSGGQLVTMISDVLYTVTTEPAPLLLIVADEAEVIAAKLEA